MFHLVSRISYILVYPYFYNIAEAIIKDKMASAAAARTFSQAEIARRGALSFEQRFEEDKSEHERMLADKNKNCPQRIGYLPVESSKPNREESGLIKIFKRAVFFSIVVGCIYYAAGSYYGFDKINKPFENAYHYVATSITHIIK